MKKSLLLTMLFLSSCASQENKMADYLKKNPKIIFDVIAENPTQFIEVVNQAARKAQEEQYAKQASEAKKQQEDQLKNPLKPDLQPRHLVYGKSQAPIVIVEYADFQCPACRMAHDTLTQIKAKYGDQVQFNYKNMPLDFHKMAMPAAKYFEAVKLVDQSKAEKFYNLVFNEQNQMQSEDYLKKAVKQIGLDPQKVSSKIKSGEIEKNIAADIQEFEKFGFTGTPAIVVNGVALNGAQPVDEIEKVIKLTTKQN
ncbi:MAG: DsbA family protein [Pseudobdellovibrio sp.]